MRKQPLKEKNRENKDSKKNKKKLEEVDLKREIKEKDFNENLEETEEENIKEKPEYSEEEINSNSFSEFLQTSKIPDSPLNKIETAEETRTTNLEGDIGTTYALESNKEEENSFKYSVGSNLDEEPKYIFSERERGILNISSIINPIELGKNNSFLPQEISFLESPLAKIGKSDRLYKTREIERKDIDKLGRENRFEKKEIKYHPSERY